MFHVRIPVLCCIFLKGKSKIEDLVKLKPKVLPGKTKQRREVNKTGPKIFSLTGKQA